MKNILVISFVATLFSQSVFAGVQQSISKVNETSYKTSKEKDSNQTQTKKIDVDQFSAKFWGLSPAEWQRYKLVKTFAKQLGNKTAESTPLEVLAIFADTQKDRVRYARLFAEKMDIYNKSLLASERAVDAVQSEMYANTPMISQSRLNALTNSPMKESDRVQLFTTNSTDFPTELLLRQLIREARNYGNKLDVFVRTSKGGDLSDSELRKWAQKFVPQDLAKNGQITINHDKGFSKKHHLVGAISFISHNNGRLKLHVPYQ